MGPVRSIVCLAAGIAAAHATRAATLSDADLAAMEGKYGAHRQIDGVGGWTADFQQEVKSPDLAQPITSRGKLDFESPDALTLTYAEPVAGQVAMIHGKFQQVFPGRKAESSSAELLQSLVQFFHLPPQAWRAQFAITATMNAGLLTIHLAVKPGASTTQPATIEEAIDSVTFDPVSLEIGFSNHTSLKFIFTNWQRTQETRKTS
jgi:hypothetical protein